METRYEGVVSRTADRALIDEGLRQHMLRVYNYMTLGVGLTGAVAFAVSTSPTMMEAIFGTGLFWIVALAPLAVVFFVSFRINHISFGTAQAAFWIFAGLMGLSLSSIFIAYTGTSIARTFFVTAASFGALSLYGYTTKRDLSAMGKFLFMGLIGLLLAMLVNIFLGSPGLDFAISAIGVLIFAGLTAYDTQKIKEMYLADDGAEIAGKKAIMGALTLYLDFINLFLFLLRFMGNRE